MSSIQYLIFAEHYKNRKCIVPAPRDKSQIIIAMLNQKEGGSWVLVDQLQPGEGILFTDDLFYRGYSPDIERYIGNSLIKFP